MPEEQNSLIEIGRSAQLDYARPKVVRLEWLDLFRLVAIFGVVIIHSSPTNPSAAMVVGFFLNFAMPFFLTSALFFFIREITKPGRNAWFSFCRRLPRLIGPYLIWSVIYLLLRAIKVGGGKVKDMIGADVVGHVLMGKGAIHLYFIPLLIVALVIALATSRVSRILTSRPLSAILVAMGVAALVPVERFWFGTPIENQLWLWINLAFLHLFGAAALVACDRVCQSKDVQLKGAVILFLSFLGFNAAWCAGWLPYAWLWHSWFLSLLLAGSALLAGSRPVPAFLRPLLPLSYGIFLSHHLFQQAIEFSGRKIFPGQFGVYSVPLLFFGAGIIMFLAAVFTRVCLRGPGWTRILVGS